MNIIENERTHLELQNRVNAKPNKKAIAKKTTILKKIDSESARIFDQIKERINKKPHGRKIRDWEILAVAIKQINSDHIKELQVQTYSERDRLALAHEEYQKTHGKIGLDQFIDKLLRREI